MMTDNFPRWPPLLVLGLVFLAETAFQQTAEQPKKKAHPPAKTADTSSAYNAGYTAGATNTSGANANAAAASAAYTMGSVHAALPTGCTQRPVTGGGTYYLCGMTWFKPSFGTDGIYYRVVPTP